VSSPSLLIECTSPHPGRGAELEDWLQGAVARLGCERIGLYRARREDRVGPKDPRADQPGRVWFLAVVAESAIGSAALDELVAEMRLLGLSPTIFRQGDYGSTRPRLMA
jgi:hypothetical protein